MMDRLGFIPDFFVSGGPVMIPLLLLSVWMWAVIIKEGRSLAGIGFASASRKRAGWGIWDQAGIGRLPKSDPRRRAWDWFGVRRMGTKGDRLLWEAAVHRRINRLGRRTRTVLMLAMTAPLLGLLGTVTGMVETFEVIGWYGLSNIHGLAAGIREALITTQIGLLIAVPGFIAGRFLKRRTTVAHREMMVFKEAVDRRICAEADYA